MPKMKKNAAVKKATIVEDLRQAILRGDYTAGSRLPTRRALCNHYNASSVTLQRAVDILIEEGFIEARGRNGSFISDTPPHLADFIMMFPHAAVYRENLFFKSLEKSIRKIEEREKINITIYRNIENEKDLLSYQELISKIQERKIAGIIMVRVSQFIMDIVDSHSNQVPVISVSNTPLDNMSYVTMDNLAYIRKACQYFKDQGTTKLAIISMKTSFANYDTPDARTIFDEYDIDLRPHWFHQLDVSVTQSAKNIAEVLMKLPEDERPNALLIDDDHFVIPALDGLREVGIDPENDISVIAHSNYPNIVAEDITIKRLGFNTDELILSAINRIRDQRDAPEGSAVENAVISPLFLSEYLEQMV
jgi:DNA-binding LacI/PurR family transcriptional regulator